MNKKSLTLVEVVVAMLILASCVAGMFAVFVSGKKISARARRKIIAVNYARKIADSLKSEVRQDTYNSGALSCTPTYPCDKSSALSAPTSLFNAENKYHIDNIPVGSAFMRKVTINVIWDEP